MDARRSSGNWKFTFGSCSVSTKMFFCDVFAESDSTLITNGGNDAGKFPLRSRNGISYVIDEHLVLIAVPLRAMDILRNGRMPAPSIALHDDAVGTIFENRPMCNFNALAMPDEPPAIEDVEALRLGGFEPKKPTGEREKFRFFFC